MASVNKVILVGHAGRDAEVKYMPSGDPLANVTLATSETWKDKSTGEKKEATEWHRLVFNGKLADIVGQYVKKGTMIYVEGALRTRKWTDKDGVEKYTTEVRCHEMRLLSGRPEGQQSAPQERPAPQPQRQAAPSRPAPSYADDDIPFDRLGRGFNAYSL